MPTSKRSSVKKAAAAEAEPKKPKPSPKKPHGGDQPPSPVLSTGDSIERAQKEAEARQAFAQNLVDLGLTLVGAGEDETGHYFVVVHPDKEEPETVYMEAAQS